MPKSTYQGHVQGRMHGGPDALGAARFDFSTNSNACGPCPLVWVALQQADPSAYPDPSYTLLRTQLGAHHGVDPARVVVAGSASEFIFRMTAWVAQQYWADDERPAQGLVSVPRNAYGDYAAAARAWGLQPVEPQVDTRLVWCCEPSSPLGGAQLEWPSWVVDTLHLTEPPDSMEPVEVKIFKSIPVVLDCAYAPLRLHGASVLNAQQRARVWQLYSPNKALGLTGVRAAYAIAPMGMQGAVAELERMAPSWPVGAHGVAMLQAWVRPEVQSWLTDTLHTLRGWKARQIERLQALGWICLPSDANFFCASPPEPVDLPALRAQGIKLRDATSFGLPGYIRLGVLEPAAQDALTQVLAMSSSE
jgi:histidinol-phosphate aminotransferase